VDWSALGSGATELQSDTHTEEQGDDRVCAADIASGPAIEQGQEKGGKDGKEAGEHG
jgi:hypothetical protein